MSTAAPPKVEDVERGRHDAAAARQPGGRAPAQMELRILSGCHRGARLDVAAGAPLRVGSAGDCEVLLSDCGLAPGAPLRLWWQDGRWFVQAQGAAAATGRALGAAALLGRVRATVCAAHLPWTAGAPAGEDAGPHGGTHRGTATRRLGPLAAVCVLALALLGAGRAVWRHAPAAAQAGAAVESAAPSRLSPQEQEQAVKAATLAIALADPALRMQVAADARGGVTVSGWVEDAQQFDRLAQALSGLRPLPRLAVRTAQDVVDALTDAAAAQGLGLRFVPLGAGKVQVRGVVATADMRQQALAQLRARAPAGLEIVDALCIASQQGPQVLRWLGAQGLKATEARWDGGQLVLAVELTPAQRPQLERLLVQAQSPLSDVPFLLRTRVVEASAAARRLGLAEARLPFRVRGVVGGAAPYVVLADGAKLQPGGVYAGWRLAAIAPDHLVFDGPQRLEVNR